jgi:hypothetical protein
MEVFMLGLGIFDYIKIGIIAALVIVCGYLIWNYQHMKTVIATQQDQIASLELGQQVLANEQDKFKKFMAARSTVARKVTNEQDEIRQSEAASNDADLDRRFERFYGGVQPQGQGSNPAPGQPGGTRNAAP